MTRVATDIGGTFTDLVALDNDGKVVTLKSHTTPPNFEDGVLNVIKESGLAADEIEMFLHGTTTIINALTERKGAKTALITTRGFRDILEIARCNRPDLFNLVFAKPRPFVPRYLRLEVTERVATDGSVLEPLVEEDVLDCVEKFKQEGVESIAICFLNSYINDEHEMKALEIVRRAWPEIFVTASAEVTREWREYERTSTVVLNSYVLPIASLYLDRLETKLEKEGFVGKKYVMQSNGGSTTFEQARQTPINLLESGPVAGVLGSAILGKMVNEENIISMDIGGTTAKCSLIDRGQARVTTEYRIERTERYAGYPVMIPVIDIVEIGNGGGSIAHVDAAGSLRVGPESAGAMPGPVAYGLGGTEPTTTDACLVTGRLSADNFEAEVDLDKVRAAIEEKVAKPLGISVDQAALDIIRVAEANMVNALKLISVRRGYDPREFVMVAHGGGGPMHSAALARDLMAHRVIVPNSAAVFSAWGMLMTDIRHDWIRTHICPLETTAATDINAIWDELKEKAYERMHEEGLSDKEIIYQAMLDMRYQGQEHTVPVNTTAGNWDDNTGDGLIESFHRNHEHFYTYRLDGTPVEIVNFHLIALGVLTKPELSKIPVLGHEIIEPVGERDVLYDDGKWRTTPVYERSDLKAGFTGTGPLLIDEKTATTVVLPEQELTVDEYGHLIIETGVK
ncbi:MAG TPA: hydantoinase/oxoprolinase family protein [Clostridiaceae bacterium]|nr:hydantoinase/oxoprolinase family protein [Clostridiaceae bacterium]